MDTVTLVRSAIRGLLRAADADLGSRLRAALTRDDDYATAGKPVCDYDDPAAREALVDAMALLAVLDGAELDAPVEQAAQLLAQVVGQDLDQHTDGVFRIARRVAKDRVISTVDADARHGHKTSARGVDGYKGHVAIDPDSVIITATTATAGNTGDAEAAGDLLADDLPTGGDTSDTSGDSDTSGTGGDGDRLTEDARADADQDEGEPLAVYGDAAYGTGEMLQKLERAGAD